MAAMADPEAEGWIEGEFPADLNLPPPQKMSFKCEAIC